MFAAVLREVALVSRSFLYEAWLQADLEEEDQGVEKFYSLVGKWVEDLV